MKQNEEVLKEATKAQRQVTQVRESVGLMPSRSWEICPCFHLHTIYIGEKNSDDDGDENGPNAGKRVQNVLNGRLVFCDDDDNDHDHTLSQS